MEIDEFAEKLWVCDVGKNNLNNVKYISNFHGPTLKSKDWKGKIEF